VDSTTPGASAGSNTVHRALRVLEELGETPAGVTASALARRVGVNRVTVHRILSALRAHGFVTQAERGGPYRLGYRFVEFGERVIAANDAIRIAQPLLEELAELTGETCHFALLDGAEAVYVAKVESQQAVRLVSRIGVRVPLYCTSLGKAALAAMSEERAAELVADQSFEARTPTTIVSKQALLAELAHIRRRGWAVDEAENEPGVRCAGAAVLGRDGVPIGAISVSGPEWRVDDVRIQELGTVVAQAAVRLSEVLAGREDVDSLALDS